MLTIQTSSNTKLVPRPITSASLCRDGCRIFFESPGPEVPAAELKQTQPKFQDPAVKAEMYKKVVKVKKRRYLLGTTLENLKSITLHWKI
jgi:hypothetical protein